MAEYRIYNAKMNEISRRAMPSDGRRGLVERERLSLASPRRSWASGLPLATRSARLGAPDLTVGSRAAEQSQASPDHQWVQTTLPSLVGDERAEDLELSGWGKVPPNAVKLLSPLSIPVLSKVASQLTLKDPLFSPKSLPN